MRDHELLSIFGEAIEIESESEREKFLAQAFGDNAQSLKRVRQLLSANLAAGKFLETEAVAERPGTSADEQWSSTISLIGKAIGPYKLLEQIGQGGMGSVYMAQQTAPVKRKVALKVIKAGMDSKEVVARFEAERQALAMMDHPHIAKVLDGGTTEQGRPYFVMELVRGVPITEFCDQKKLGLRQRIELFVDVCRAVQHAHQKGIIHRDLKPSNILVELLDGKPLPKVIDFGVAKAIGQQLTEHSQYTSVGQIIGTPLYMSPEQADMSGLDVDTRSDVYSLGVLLYELLSGSTPFEKDRLNQASYDELRRIIREEEPMRPSTCISTLTAAALSTTAAQRQIEPRKFSQLLRGELDWIVMKALEKDRSRRYETANAFARDIERYLADEAVEARPPSPGYRTKKFLRRNKGLAISASLVMLALAVMSLLGLSLAAYERELAQRRQQVQEGISSALAEVTRIRGLTKEGSPGDDETLRQVNEHMQRALALAEAGPADARMVAEVRQLSANLEEEQRDKTLLAALDVALDSAATDADQSRFDSEAVVPLLRETLAEYGLQVERGTPTETAARIASASPVVREQLLAALETWREALFPPVGIRWQKKNQSTRVVVRHVTNVLREKVKPGDQLVGVGQGRDGLIADTRDLTISEISQHLQGDPGTMVRLEMIASGETQSHIFEVRRDPTTAWLWAVINAADPDPWRRRLRNALEMKDEAQQRAELELLADDVDMKRQPVRPLTQLAKKLGDRQANERAIKLFRQLQQEHPGDAWVNHGLAWALQHDQPAQTDEAIRYYTAAVALRPDSAGMRLNLGSALEEIGELERAFAEYSEVVTLLPHYAAAHHNLGIVLEAQSKRDEAIAEFREAVRLQPDSANFHYSLGATLHSWGKESDECVAELREAVRLEPENCPYSLRLGFALGNGGGTTEEEIAVYRASLLLNDNGGLHANLALALDRQGRTEEAIAEFRLYVERAPTLWFARFNLGRALANQGTHLDEAIVELREAIRLNPEDRADCHYGIALASQKLGNLEEAANEYREAIRIDPSIDSYAQATGNLANCLSNLAWRLATAPDASQRDPAKAVELAQEVVQLKPDSANGWNNLGVALYRNGQMQEAVDGLEKADKLIDGGDREHRMFLAMATWQLGNKESASTRFAEGAAWIAVNRKNDVAQNRFRAEAELLLGLSEQDRNDLIAEYYRQADIDDAKALTDRGRWYQSQGNDPQAIEDLTTAIELDPKATSAVQWRSRGICYYNLQQDENALADFCKALELKPNEVWSLKERGRVYQRLGQLDLALADISKCIELKPTQNSERQNYLQRAGIYRDLREFDLALADCQQAIDIDPENDAIWFARQAAYEFRGDIYAENLQQYDKAIVEYDKATELDPENATYAEKRSAVVQAMGHKVN